MSNKQSKLHVNDKENILRAFEEYNPVGNTWIDKWGIFKNNTQLICLYNNWHYARRNEATMNRNLFVSELRIYERTLIGRLGSGPSPIASVAVHWERPIRLFFPVHVDNYSSVYKLREEEPEFFEQLCDLFPVRQITEADIAGISRQLGIPPNNEDDEE